MRYHFKIHKEGRGYWAQGIELKGCVTQADSKAKLLENLEEALNGYLDERQDSNAVFPEPKKTVRGSNVVAVKVDPRIAFATTMRNARMTRGMTQKKAADKLGVKLYSYQRLESSKTANPEWVTISKIKQVFPEFELDKIA